MFIFKKKYWKINIIIMKFQMTHMYPWENLACIVSDRYIISYRPFHICQFCSFSQAVSCAWPLLFIACSYICFYGCFLRLQRALQCQMELRDLRAINQMHVKITVFPAWILQKALSVCCVALDRVTLVRKHWVCMTWFVEGFGWEPAPEAHKWLPPLGAGTPGK